MSELARTEPTEMVAFTNSDLETLRNVIAPGIPEPDLALFSKVCAQLGLSPFRGEIVVTPRRTRDPNSPKSNPRWLTVWRHQVTVVGRRVMAERTGEVEGIVGPEWCGPHHPEPDSPLKWVDVWLRDEPPHAARCTVYRRGRKPYVGTTPWREFAQRYTDEGGNERPSGLWATMPAHMLGKTAENLALGRAFPELRDTIKSAGIEWEDAPRDEYAGPMLEDAPSGARGSSATREPSPTRPRDPNEVMARDLIRPDQVQRIQRLFEALELDGEQYEATRRAIIVRAIGHEYETAHLLSPSEGGAIIGELELMRAEQEARDAPEPEGDDDECAG